MLESAKIGGRVGHILIWPLGGLAVTEPTEGKVLDDFWVALAGKLILLSACALRSLF
jgi:hypothetical protein